MLGMPARNQSFADAGQQGLYSKQMQPRRAYSNGLYSDPVPLGNRGVSDSWSANVDNGMAYLGYGVCTMGEYTTANGDWKTFGSVGQGSILQSVKQINSNDCEPRSTFITLYAINDFKQD
jgi:hypothetical protein